MSDGTYYRVSPRFWRDRSVKAWPDATRLLAFYMLNNDHRTTEGLFYMPQQYAAVDMGWSQTKLEAAWSQLVDDGFMDWDPDADVVLIHRAVFYQPPANDKVVVAAVRRLADVPKTRLLVVFAESLAELDGKAADSFREAVSLLVSKRFPNGIDEVSKPGFPKSGNPIELSSLPHTQTHTQPSAQRFDRETWETWWSLYPRKIGKKAAEAKYRAALKTVDAETLRSAIEAQAKRWARARTEEKYIPHATTWLSQGRWDDEQAKPRAVAAADTSHDFEAMTDEEVMAAAGNNWARPTT